MPRVPPLAGGASSVLPITLDTVNSRVGINNVAPATALSIGDDIGAGGLTAASEMTIGAATSGTFASIRLGQASGTAFSIYYSSNASAGSRALSIDCNGYSYPINVDCLAVKLQCANTSGNVLIGTPTDNQNAKVTINRTAGDTSGTARGIGLTYTFNPTSGTGVCRPVDIAYTVNQTGGANGTVTGIMVNATETAVVGTHNLMDLQVASTSMFAVDNKGGFQCASAALATGATAGLPRLRTCAGTPTGAVADGSFMIDTTGNKLWARSGGAWKGIAIV